MSALILLVFLGAAGDPLLRGAVRHGVLPEPALLEGVAVAADWPGGRLTIHEQVKALREARLEPPLERLFGLSFWGHGSGRAYTVAGSFFRYLLDQSGPGPLLKVYRAGGAEPSFQAAYGRPRAELAAAWRRYIDGLPLRPNGREVARGRLRRPAGVAKVGATELVCGGTPPRGRRQTRGYWPPVT